MNLKLVRNDSFSSLCLLLLPPLFSLPHILGCQHEVRNPFSYKSNPIVGGSMRPWKGTGFPVEPTEVSVLILPRLTRCMTSWKPLEVSGPLVPLAVVTENNTCQSTCCSLPPARFLFSLQQYAGHELQVSGPGLK